MGPILIIHGVSSGASSEEGSARKAAVRKRANPTEVKYNGIVLISIVCRQLSHSELHKAEMRFSASSGWDCTGSLNPTPALLTSV